MYVQYIEHTAWLALFDMIIIDKKKFNAFA